MIFFARKEVPAPAVPARRRPFRIMRFEEMALSYAVKEIFLTLQGEGAHAGRAAVFCRFSGCNLWSGRETDRERAVCRFCDTDFTGLDGTLGGRYASADELADTLAAQVTGAQANRHRSLTGRRTLLAPHTR